MWGVILALTPVIFGLLAISALFSAAETALTGASRTRMHQLEREGDRAAGRVNRLISDQETMIGAVLLGNNLINILASAVTTEFVTRAIPGALGVAVATAIMTVLVLVFAEVLPKTLAILRSDDVARFLSAPTLIVVKVFGPMIWAIQWIVRRTLGLFGVKLGMEMDVLAAHEEIRGAVEYHHSEGLVEARDRRMLGGVLDLSEMDVSQGQSREHRRRPARQGPAPGDFRGGRRHVQRRHRQDPPGAVVHSGHHQSERPAERLPQAEEPLRPGGGRVRRPAGARHAGGHP